MIKSGNNRMERNRKPGKDGAGPSGQCVCIKCGYSAPKIRGIPCMDKKCPECGSTLLRKDGTHYQKAVNKK